ncbi:MAG: hypothetical protein HGB05_18870, partial [Chloroflexi bacterium]|nr:hypothetical protein [Chloroflexota bacterium]
MKKRQRHLTGRLIVIILLALLAVYSFFVGPLRALTNDILLGGLLNLSVAFAIMLAFFQIIYGLGSLIEEPVQAFFDGV